MSKQSNAEKASPQQSTQFEKMGLVGKLTHVCKICVFFITFGFAFPNVLGD